MMNTLFPALLAVAPIAMPSPAPLNPVQADMALQKELYGVLQTVNDKASADAAAPRVAEIGRAMYSNIDAIMGFLKADKAAARAAFAAMRGDAGFLEASKGWARRMAELRQSEPPCYGSTALRAALKEVKSEPKK